MTCPVCGKAQPCAHGWRNSPVVVDPRAAESGQGSSSPASGPVGSSSQSPGDVAWRKEVVSRVQQHRARRRKSTDTNALELDFTAEEPFSFTAEAADYPQAPPPERFAEIVMKPDAPKVIRFPRPAFAQPPAVEEVRLDELSAPALEAPRILEAPEIESRLLEDELVPETEAVPIMAVPPQPEQMQLLPSFDDIHLEPEASRLTEELDEIPHAAPLTQRAVAGLVDAVIVMSGYGIFALTFLELAEETPKSRLVLICALAVGGVFWLAFQYLFLIYGRLTPGMKLAQLELCTFEGKPVSISARRSRALASTLSGLAVGLGYFWAYVDEDRLGWHDRISQTYLKSLAVPDPARELYGYDDLKV